MRRITKAIQRKQQHTLGSLLLMGVLIMGSTPSFSRGPRPETIESTAMGTGTQLGQVR